MRFWLPALVVIAAVPVSAHHPFTPYYDASKLVSISGHIPVPQSRSQDALRDVDTGAWGGPLEVFRIDLTEALRSE